MEYRILGASNLEVSHLCFGSLAISPLQSSLSIKESGEIIAYALKQGINFIDTAEYYQNYTHIKSGIKNSDMDLVISTKSYAYSYEGMKKSVEKARRELDRDVIDIFMLHEQETSMTLRGHKRALEYLVDAKARGYISSIGVSTHTVEVVKAATRIDEIEVIHPIINVAGLGIKDGTLKDMEKAIEDAFGKGKGIYGMKCLGGGNLIGRKNEAFRYIKSFPKIHSIAIGMKSTDEVLANCLLFQGKPVPEGLEIRLENLSRKLVVEEWCQGCGQCVDHCSYNAMVLIEGEARVDHSKCILCGYCAGYCPEFCIKII